MTSHAFVGLLNFREVIGPTMVRGRLFRSAALDRLNDDDLLAFDRLGIMTVVDLRRYSEREAAPSRRSTAQLPVLIESEDSTAVMAPHERFLSGDDLSAAVLGERMTNWYREAPFDPEHRTMFRRAIEAVAMSEGATLIHCAAGKDRTGLVVMLIQHLLGATEEAQLAEYLKTGADRRLVDGLTRRLVELAESLGKRLDPVAAEMMSGVSAGAFRASRAAIIDQCGSIDGYLRDIGIGTDIERALRRRLLEGAA